MPYTYNQISMMRIGTDVLLGVYRRNCLELLVLDSEYQLRKNIVVEEEKKEGEGDVGWLDMGEGGFENANTKHHVIVLGVGKSVTFYRIIDVEDAYEVVKVS